ncbi:HEAT repeat domain-containing protein [Terriglobus aquaticus]|uniref:HEAT repeat domain-containing protein n=1 Tax=Terriglobus aquaticus TaxID=940139 RepID=A0ABW9KM42_9BACT|nr:HEAT repeat domain-containing protein [Terriglobus aquaticus]
MTRHRFATLTLAFSVLVSAPTAAYAACQDFGSAGTPDRSQIIVLANAFVADQAFAFGGPAASTADDYTQGTQALDQQRWQDAITAFDKVAKAHDKRADAALYWKAYALNKLNRPNLVTATCNQLRGTYPRSTWNHDCTSLFAAAADPGIYAGGTKGKCINCIHPQSPTEQNGVLHDEDGTPIAITNRMHPLGPLSVHVGGSSSDAAGSDADLKMLALNSVLQRDPGQALPVIRTILTGNGSPQLKQRALSTLAMSQSPDAQSLFRDVATGKVATTEQRQAIQMLGAFQGKRAGDTLADIYRNSSDHNLKRAALSGLFVAGDAPRMVDLARNEKDLQLKHDIVAQLALMHDKAATDYMLELLK